MRAVILLLLPVLTLQASLYGVGVDVCDSGIHQSPIDLSSKTSIKVRMPALKWHGHSDSRKEGYDIENTGHTARVTYRGNERPWIANGNLIDTYVLEQLHFHWGQEQPGSEHAIDGQLYPMEVHFVHYKKQYGTFKNALQHYDGLAVIGILFRETAENNTQLDDLVSGLSDIREAGESTQLGSHAMAWVKPYMASSNFFTYEGSLTTPPCFEIVTWTVMQQTATIGTKQIEEFKKLQNHEGEEILDNARPLLDTNGRHVYFSFPEDDVVPA